MSKIISAIAGDIIGSVYEWNNVEFVNDIKFFSKKARYTDDTVLTCAVAKWIMDSMNNNSDKEDMFDHDILVDNLKKYGRKYRHAGYGRLFREWLDSESNEPFNSYGNGAGMRVSPVGFFCTDVETAKKWAKASAEVTHNHPEGIKGAQAIACAIVMASNGEDKLKIKNYIQKEFGYDLDRKLTDLANFYIEDDFTSKIFSRKHKFDSTCQTTVPEAIIAFLDSNSYEDAINKALVIGGDSDTIACMTGAIAGAYYGVPEWIERKALSLLPHDLAQIVVDFDDFINQRRIYPIKGETENE